MNNENKGEDYTPDYIPTGAMHIAFDKIAIEREIILKNIEKAKRNRSYFQSKNIYVVNLISSPGAGKTSIFEETLRSIGDRYSFALIESNLQTYNDSKRIKELGINYFQIDSENTRYLDAETIYEAVKSMKLHDNTVLFIENVGNSISPSLLDLGESLRVVISSVTEGENKPLKYPYMFESANVCLINKIDLLPYIPTRLEVLEKNIHNINSNLEILKLSTQNRDGIEQWSSFLLEKVYMSLR
ncbi:MAG: hydrogenase nickel incorporation protein HypB [Bacteroidales bacterium]|nr:hydrogenase nickel incorporation protein HypB [Bacteroidales bacterium]